MFGVEEICQVYDHQLKMVVDGKFGYVGQRVIKLNGHMAIGYQWEKCCNH